jgi:hypothetical protein
VFERFSAFGLGSLVAVGLVVSLVGCATGGSPPSVIVLPNGYEIVRNKASQPVIVKGGRRQVAGPVGAYVVVRDVVTGVQQPSLPSGPPSGPPSGYFVLKTSTGEVSTGLSEEDWKSRLKDAGVEQVPILNPPLL